MYLVTCSLKVQGFWYVEIVIASMKSLSIFGVSSDEATWMSKEKSASRYLWWLRIFIVLYYTFVLLLPESSSYTCVNVAAAPCCGISYLINSFCLLQLCKHSLWPFYSLVTASGGQKEWNKTQVTFTSFVSHHLFSIHVVSLPYVLDLGVPRDSCHQMLPLRESRGHQSY